MVDLNGLLVFAVVVESNSFSVAALRLKMPLATVSRRIADIEKHLGIRLLDRTTRKLRLTDTGSELLAFAQRAVELERSIVAVAKDRGAGIAGLLRLAAPPSIASTLISPVCCAFQALHPGVRTHVFITERDVDLVGDGVDLAFHVGNLRDSSFIAKRILTYRHRVLASPAYLRAAKPIRNPSDLTEHPLLGFSRPRPDTVWRFVHSDKGTQETVRFQAHVSMNDYTGIAHALTADAGVGEMPPIVEPSLVEEGRLVEVLPKWRLRTVNLSLVHPGDRHSSQLVRAFKDFAGKTASQLFPSLPT